MWTFFSLLAAKHRVHRERSRNFRPHMEALEDRCCPSPATFQWSDPTGGALDPTFGSGGQVINSFSNYYDSANAFTTQPDGKIVIAGVSKTTGSKTGNDFLVARYNTDGSVDTSFGSGGHTVTDFNRGDDSASAVAFQPQASGQSKILAAGQAVVANSYDFAVARYNADGTLDTTFGSRGKVTTGFSGIAGVQSMVVDGAGRILVAGGTGGGLALVRYTANGALDTTFGSGGKLVTNIQLRGGDAHSLALQTDGKIIVGASMIDPATSGWEFVVARFNANGTADTTFGSGGSVVTHPGISDVTFGGVAIQGDGKILLAGMEIGLDPDGVDRQGEYLLRYTTNGSLDAGFGAGGVVYLVNPSGLFGQESAGVAVQADGQIVVGGQFEDGAGTYSYFDAMRVSPAGALDTGFGDSGWASARFATGAAVIHAFALQPDGRVLLAGNARPSSATYPADVALVRFLASAPQIGSFTAAPNPVTSGSTTTLTVSNITDNNPGATVTQVAFYIMINGSGILLGYGTHNSDGSWSYVFDTTGYASGTYTLYAQATDSYGALGNPVALTLTVQ
jgi:uncharacterized delta-60 repeat protein